MPDLGCSPNAAIAYDFFVRQGLQDFQAAAIVGNLQQESKLDPQALGDGGAAHGIAQWHEPRWGRLVVFSDGNPWSLETQLEFVWHELQTVSAFGIKSILASTTIEDAVVAFQDNFEKCGACDTPQRIRFARAALFACPALKPPPLKRRSPIAGWFVAALVATAAGYGVYKVRNA